MRTKCACSLLTLALISALAIHTNWMDEKRYEDWRQTLKVDKMLIEEDSPEQHLILFENERFGKVLSLDGVVQTTEADEFIYHEMMVHVPLIAHGDVKKVLVIGGGDGGILRELVKYPEIKQIVLVEIDPLVIEMSKKYFPSLSNGAFEDPRVELVIADGAKYVKKCPIRFDVILCDSTDPVGPGAVLFSKQFYKDCKKLLNNKGIFINHAGIPFMQGKELKKIAEKLKDLYNDTTFYLAPVPTYIGGFMAFGWSSDEKSYRKQTMEDLEKKSSTVLGEFKYYSPEIHISSFGLPAFIQKIMKKGK